jgi:AcrR family transcriptional regulator
VSTVDEPALRADALRNRRRVLDAAAAAFAEGGLDVGVAEIARRAGVGPGTIFRRFPTKDDLIAAIIEQRIEEFLARADEAGEADDPGEAFRRFFLDLTEQHVRDRGLLDAVGMRFGLDPRLQELRGRLFERFEQVLERAQEAGAIRADLRAPDIGALSCAAASVPAPLLSAYPDVWRRYAGVLLDGMAPQGASELPQQAPDPSAVDAAAQAAAARRRGARPRTA